MEARLHPRVAPDYLFVASYLEELNAVALCVIAGDHGIAVREALYSTGIVEEFFADVLVGHAPDYFPCTVDLDDAIPVGATD